MSKTASERAMELFLEGYNCAQSVLGAFTPQPGLTFETAMQLSSGMGGGIGRLRETCGAVSGMVLALSLAQGYHSPGDDEKKKELYATVQRLVGQFKEENGSILCRELLEEQGKDNSPNPSARTEAYYHNRPCGELCACAARILEEYLAQSK
ncbi:MAG: C_GCAxxG_C_C family protein [Anaerotruncus sp.]|nr:C_GCAxxG_C_C family protein [Anaerotruncus sp.]